ncbi:hypothetical protein [Marinicrinis sediminis]|uniref:Uncharacterized protein n=1 Tax=Marinicrinis sediminis TaxID=1652465 RepID=A0ABW5RBK0_9BACL
MDFVLFHLFSILEVIFMITVVFVLFGIPMKPFMAQILFASFILPQISYYMRFQLELSSFVLIAYEVSLIVFLIVMFKIKWVHSLLLGVAMLLYLSFVQLATMLSAISSGLFEFTDFQPLTVFAYFVQGIFALISWLIIILLKKFKFHFQFVRYQPPQRRTVTYGKKAIGLVAGMFVCNWVIYSFVLQSIYTMSLFFVVLTLEFAILIAASLKREAV